MTKKVYYLLTFCFLIVSHWSLGADVGSEENTNNEKTSDGDEEKSEKNIESDGEKTVKEGNLSLPSSQQPGPLVGFGQNIVEKGVKQLYLFADYYQRGGGHATDIIPSFLWGFNDQFSIYYNVPIGPSYKDRKHHSSGLEDVFVQFEYAFYSEAKKYFTEQATIVFNVTLPTGSSHVNPPLGYGASSCFIGTTYNHTEVEWFYYGSLGSILTSSTKRCTKFGNQFLYECGFGRNIPSPEGWIYAWMVEIDGEYSSRNRKHGKVDKNSGGNVIFVTPSLWVSNETFILQLGIGGPIYQHTFGHQLSYLYQVILNLGYTF